MYLAHAGRFSEEDANVLGGILEENATYANVLDGTSDENATYNEVWALILAGLCMELATLLPQNGDGPHDMVDLMKQGTFGVFLVLRSKANQ